MTCKYSQWWTWPRLPRDNGDWLYFASNASSGVRFRWTHDLYVPAAKIGCPCCPYDLSDEDWDARLRHILYVGTGEVNLPADRYDDTQPFPIPIDTVDKRGE